MRRFLALSLTALLFVAFSHQSPLHAQMVDCTVSVNYDAVQNTNKDLLRDFASDIKEYVNNFQWGAENVPDKVKCTLDIFIQGVTGDNKYLAQVFVGSQRPVFKSKNSTAVIRLKDDAWEFTYVKSRPISHNLYSFNDLASLLDFYMSVVVGLDSDTYDRDGGNASFQRASDICSMGNSSGQKGWQVATTGYSRKQFIDEILMPKLEPVRLASYLYHFDGLDSLSIDPDRAKKNILLALDQILKVRNDYGTRSLLMKAFFDAKYQELAQLFATDTDRTIYRRLALVDPNHQATYDEYSKKP